MQEEPEPGAASHRARLEGDVHQMIIVHPDEIVVAGFGNHRRRELAVDLLIRVPVARIEAAERLQVVEQRPDDFVGEALIEVVHFLGFEHHGAQRIAGLPTRLRDRLFEIRAGVRGARPADPHAAAIRQHRQQRRDEAARAFLAQPAAVGVAFEDERQAVRDHHQAIALIHARRSRWPGRAYIESLGRDDKPPGPLGKFMTLSPAARRPPRVILTAAPRKCGSDLARRLQRWRCPAHQASSGPAGLRSRHRASGRETPAIRPADAARRRPQSVGSGGGPARRPRATAPRRRHPRP